MHPAYSGLAGLPFYDDFDLSTVDVLLISQYVDHISLQESPVLSLSFNLSLQHMDTGIAEDIGHHKSPTGPMYTESMQFHTPNRLPPLTLCCDGCPMRSC
jgi:cleavage and polyadenylation specificity factor subunit 3